MTRPFFARERIADFETFERYTSQTLDLLGVITSSGAMNGAIDAQDLYARFTMDSASEFLFDAMQRLLLQSFSSNETECKFDQIYEPASCRYSIRQK